MARSTQRLEAARWSLLKVHLTLETDFLLARQRAKQIASLLGFELQDQTRIATAVSEIARNAWEYATGGQVEFFLDPSSSVDGDGSSTSARHDLPTMPQLRIVISDSGPGIPHIESIWAGTYQSQTGMGVGLIGARRLLDDLQVSSSPAGTVAVLSKRLPRHVPPPPTLSSIAASLARLADSASSGPAVALHDQNQELLTLLGDLRARESELRALNVELEETNRGVLVLYSELADKAQAVQQASEMKTRFLSGITHELRTPLNSIVSLARLMLHHADGPLNPEQDKQVTFILRSAQNLSDMVNDLLDLAKLEAGKSPAVLSRFTLQDLFGGLRGMFRPLATDPNVRLIFESPDQPLELLTDEGKLSQILRNFISNALKFTREGTITVSAEPLHGNAERMIRFSVADTGIGIAAEHHHVVMEEWGQAPVAPTGKARGSGLGLPLSRSLAELLNGSIGFTSAPGQGSTFWVTLPALVQPVVAVPEEPATGHILIVDDDEVARYLLKRQLGTLTSAPIEEATSGPEALEAIARNPPRIVFLDLVLPGMSGAEVAKAIRSRTESATLPVVLHTGKMLPQDEISALQSLDLTVITKRSVSGNTLENIDAQTAEMERALLEVGLSNLHQEDAR